MKHFLLILFTGYAVSAKAQDSSSTSLTDFFSVRWSYGFSVGRAAALNNMLRAEQLDGRFSDPGLSGVGIGIIVQANRIGMEALIINTSQSYEANKRAYGALVQNLNMLWRYTVIRAQLAAIFLYSGLHYETVHIGVDTLNGSLGLHNFTSSYLHKHLWNIPLGAEFLIPFVKDKHGHQQLCAGIRADYQFAIWQSVWYQNNLTSSSSLSPANYLQVHLFIGTYAAGRSRSKKD